MVEDGEKPLVDLTPGSSYHQKFLEFAWAALGEGKSGQFLKWWTPAATTSFLLRATGTFGLAVVCTVWPDTVVIAAHGQPLSVGFCVVAQHWYPQLVLWSSEPAALNTLVKNGSSRSGRGHARLDLVFQLLWVLLEISVHHTGISEAA